MSAFLDDEDLRRLTGYKRAPAQARWLESNGIPFILNRLGRPVVRREALSELRSPEPELGPVP